MIKENTTGVVPRLRFAEFKNLGPWAKQCFNKLFDLGSGRDYKHLAAGNIPVYGSGGYMTSVNDYLYDGESVCIGRKGTIDKPQFLIGKFWTVDTLFYTHSFVNCTPRFVNYLFQNVEWAKHSEAGGIPSLSKKIIGEISTYIPETAEQQKIADCLSSLDELIGAENHKLEALKAHKRGLMQGLFPAEGETMPVIRFAEFQTEWARGILRDFYDLLSGQHLDPDEYTSTSANRTPYFSGPSDFSNHIGRVTKFALIEGKRAKRGNILITVKGSGVGTSILLELDEVVIGRQLMAISSSIASVPFLFYQMGTWTGYYQSMASGNMIPGLSRMDLLLTPITLPSVAEQTKISKVLTSLDNLITIQIDYVESIQRHKKGLTQAIFPS